MKMDPFQNMDCNSVCDRESLPEADETLESQKSEAKMELREKKIFCFPQIPNPSNLKLDNNRRATLWSTFQDIRICLFL